MAPKFRLSKLRKQDSTPNRQVTGTPYTAAGADQIKPPTFNELGSAVGQLWPDPIPDVGQSIAASRTYTKMVRDDATVRVSLRAGKAPVLGADYFIDPYSDDPLHVAIAEFVDYNLFGGMTVPWTRLLEQVLTMYEYGKSVFEPVWEMREWAPKQTNSAANRKQYTMLRKLAFRPSSTIANVNYDDNGGPVSVTHTAIDAKGKAKTVTIPIEKLVIFTFDQQGGGIEGMSVLRSAYKHWIYKDKLYAIDAIQKERHGMGVPRGTAMAGASPADIIAAHEMLANIRTNEKAYILAPQNIPIDFVELKGQPVDVLKSIEHHDVMIMKNTLVQFLNSGTNVSGGGGGRASGATSMDMFMKSMRYVAKTICDSINLYVIPNLVAYNFQTDNFPQLKVRNVGEVKDLQMFSAALRNLRNSEYISLDEPTENWVREQFDMPRFTGIWKEPEDRQQPNLVEDIIKGTTTTNGNTPPPAKSDHSKNGGGGNIGLSPSSGAV